MPSQTTVIYNMDKLAAVIRDVEEGKIDEQFACLILEQIMENEEQNQGKKQQRIKDRVSEGYLKMHSSTPEEYVLEKERMEDLHSFIFDYLGRLTPRYREVFLRRYIYGESIKKIGRDLNISFQAVDCYLKRIDAKRKKILSKLLEHNASGTTSLREEIFGLLTEHMVHDHKSTHTLMGFPFESYVKGKCRLKEYLSEQAPGCACSYMHSKCKNCNKE